MRYKTRELNDNDEKEIIQWLEAHGFEPQQVKKLKDISIDEQIKTLEKYLQILKTKRSSHEQRHPLTGQTIGPDGSLDD
jgi:uncharacterized protein (DUF3820 family)